MTPPTHTHTLSPWPLLCVQGAKLLHVSDLLLLGRATIEESLLLLHWLGQAGHERLGAFAGRGCQQGIVLDRPGPVTC